MNNELRKLMKFITFKKETIEKIIDDDASTKYAIGFIVISIFLGVLYNFFIQDNTIPLYVPFTNIRVLYPFVKIELNTLRIILDTVFLGIFPFLHIILTFHIGNRIGGDAESRIHILRVFGYSTFLNICRKMILFLNAFSDTSIFISICSWSIEAWEIILIIFSLYIAFKKGVFTAIIAYFLSGIIATIPFILIIFIN